MIFCLSPLVWFSRLITRMLGSEATRTPGVDRDELMAMARMGAESGHLLERESLFVQNLIQMNAMHAGDIMTPRTVVFSLPESLHLTETLKLIEDKPFSRIPVYGSTRDEVTGFVMRTEVLLAHLKNRDDENTISSLKRPIGMVHEHTPLDELFQKFIAERRQIMIVIDRFGTPLGLVSFEDIIETIFGFEIVDEKDKIPDMQILARNLWKERMRKMGISIQELETLMGENTPPSELKKEY
jgi:CBS domain containing-hemolysin-like protein